MTVKRRRWTKEEEDYIKDHYKTRTVKDIAEVLGRSERSVIMRARHLGVAKLKIKRWTEEEEDYLKKNFKKKSFKEMADHLERTEKSVSKKALGMGLRRKTPYLWTDEELKYLKDHFMTKSYEDIGKEIGRSADAVSKKAHGLGYPQALERKRKEAEQRKLLAKLESMRELDIGKSYRFESTNGDDAKGFPYITGKVIETTDRLVIVDCGAFKISYMYTELGVDYIVKEV